MSLQDDTDRQDNSDEFDLEEANRLVVTGDLRISELEAVLRDIIFGCDGMLHPALQISGSMRGFITEVKRVATEGLK